MTKHPTDFYTAHRLFTFQRQGKTVTEWGGLTDGPADRAELMEALHEFDSYPTLQTLRVYHFQADVPARDVTEDVIDMFLAEVAQ